MEIIIIGGFLGSGKTTLVNKLLQGIQGEGATVAVIENELGTVGVDQNNMEDKAVEVVPLLGGCVCCQTTGELIGALHQMKNQWNPDYIVVELTGMALLDTMREKLLQFGSFGAPIHLIGVVDGSRWEVLEESILPMLEKQLQGTDLVLINKVDAHQLPEEKIQSIQDLAGHQQWKAISATERTAKELWDMIKEVFV